MPKLVEKVSNPVNLLLPKSPPAKQPRPEREFNHVLNDARPKPQVPAASERQASPEVREGEQPATDPQAQVDAPKQPETELPPNTPEVVEDESVPGEALVKRDPEATDETFELIDPPLLAESVEIPTLTAQVVVPDQTLDVKEISDDSSEVDAPAISVVPTSIPELDQQTPSDVEPDVPQPITLATRVVPFQHQEVDLDVPTDAEPAAPVSVVKFIDSDSLDAQTSADDPEAESDQPATASFVAKLKPVKPQAEQNESTEESFEQVLKVPTPEAVKELALTPDGPRTIDAPVVKSPTSTPTPAQPPAPPLPAVQAEADFAATNHDRIVTSVRSQLLPNGGTMRIRLDPPELGQMQITVRMIDGVMQASFETTSDQATRLLSHSLSHLKSALETQGVSVDKLQVQQSPRDQQSSSSSEDQQRQSQNPDSQAQREQQRRELLNRMWRRMRLGSDPLDMVA